MRTRRSTRFTVTMAAAVLSVGALGACGDDDPGVAAPPSPTVEDTLDAVSATPTTTVDEENPSPTPTLTRPRATPTRTPTRTPSRTANPAAFPPAVENPQQGGEYWAAVVAVSDDIDDPMFKPLIDSLREDGYTVTEGQGLDCYSGANTFLGVNPDPGTMFAIVELFTSQAQAKQFERAYGGDLAGIGKVQTYCLDGAGD